MALSTEGPKLCGRWGKFSQVGVESVQVVRGGSGGSRACSVWDRLKGEKADSALLFVKEAHLGDSEGHWERQEVGMSKKKMLATPYNV